MGYQRFKNPVFWLRGFVAAFLCVASSALPLAAFADDRVWQTLSELEFPPNTPTAFSEARKTRLQLRAKTQSGELWLADDNVLVMSIETPRPELRKISANQLSIERGGKVRSLKLDPARAAHQLPLIIVDVLSGDTTRLRDSFRVSPSPAPTPTPTPKVALTEPVTPTSSWSWRLVPIDKTLEKQLTALTLSGKGNRLLTLRTERASSYQEIAILAEPALSK